MTFTAWDVLSLSKLKIDGNPFVVWYLKIASTSLVIDFG